MKIAKITDGWRRSKEEERYNSRLVSLDLRLAEGFEGKLSFEFQSGVTVICGKNGVGKSTLLKLIHYALCKERVDGFARTSGSYSAHLKCGQSLVEYSSEDLDAIYETSFYCEPAKDCHAILEYWRMTPNVQESLEGVEDSRIFLKGSNKQTIENIIGKNYSKIEVYEIVDLMKPDFTFPFFKVELNSGVSYSILEMGMGEFICLYIFWLVNWVPKNAVLMLDELDSFIAVYSQKYLVDYLAYTSAEKSMSLVVSTHSEAIISAVGLESTLVLNSYLGGQTKLVLPKHERAYLTALGVSPRMKGVFLVEDRCARLLLENILKTYLPDMFSEYKCVGLRCDPNLTKIAKHFEPHNEFDFEMIVVFDADQSEKIQALNESSYLYVSALPSLKPEPPESALWDYLLQSIDIVASRFNFQIDELENVINLSAQADLHDRLHAVASGLNVNFDTLIHSLATEWARANVEIVTKFLLAMESRRGLYSSTEIVEFLRSKLPNFQTPQIFEDAAPEARFLLTFNGIDFDYSKS